jgi:hypothetical protein
MREFDVENSQPGGRMGTKIYDATAQSALLLLADGLQGYLVSPSMKWFREKFEIEELDDTPDAKMWLEECDKHLYSVFAGTNFYEQMYSIFCDGGSIGTAILYLEEDLDTQKIVFNCLHPFTCYVQQDRYKRIDTIHRKFKLSAREAVKKFKDGNISQEIQEAADKDPDLEFVFIHAVWPNEDRYKNGNKKYASVYFEENGKEIIQEGGYDDNPYAVWRWRTNSNEIYGRSPSHDALVEISKLNQIGKDMLKASHIAVNPPMMVPWEFRGRARLTAGGLNYYRDANRPIQPVTSGINWPIGLDREDKIKEIIRKFFKVDFFLLLAQQERQQTATEIIEKQGEKAAILGATIGRLNNELLNPVLDRVFNIEYRAGRLPPIPEALQRFGGQLIRIDYMGPLAQAQRRLFQGQGIDLSMAKAMPMFEMDPSSMDILNKDEIVREIFDANGMPTRLIHTHQEVEDIRQQRAQQQQQQQQMMMAAEAAKAAPGLSKPVAEDSIIGKIEQESANALESAAP